MSERFKVTKFEEPSGKTYKNYGATSADTDLELTGKLLPNSGDSKSFDSRIIGGTLTTINAYPYGTGILITWDFVNYVHSCGGTIITNTAVLTAAHCFSNTQPNRYRIRVGSSFANSGGAVHNLRQIIIHPSYNMWTHNNDVSVIRTQTVITYIPNTVVAATIAGSNYNPADNQPVWAIGWGLTSVGGPTSEQLRHVQIWVVNQNTCRTRYAEVGWTVTDNMLCAGWLDVGGRDQCQMDSGGPLIHNTVVVGICSFGHECAHPRYPGVNTRVSRYASWIQAAAV